MQSTQLEMFAVSRPQQFFGKTSPESSAQKTTPSAVFWERLPVKIARSSRQGGVNGRTLVVCLDPSARLLGGYSMPNISEWPNDAVVCSLSQVLETGSIPQRYFLSSTACAGILRRAVKRGKTLPEQLARALLAVVDSARTLNSGGGFKQSGIDDLAHSLRAQAQARASHRADNETYVPVAFGGNNLSGSIDIATARNACGSGSGSGRIDFESETFLVQQTADLIAGGQLARCLTTKTRIDAETETLIPTFGGDFSLDAQITGTLQSNGKAAGSATQQDTEAGLLVPIAFNARQDPDSWADRTGPLDTHGGTQAVRFSSKDYGADASIELAPTMRAMNHAVSHANGGGQLAVGFVQNSRDEVRLMSGDGQIVGALAAETGAKQQCYIAQCVTGDITHTLKAEGFDASEDGTGRGQPIVAFKPGQSEAAGGFFATEEFAPTLQAQNNGSTAVPAIQYGMAVRRLTPRECERLQGYEDDHTLIPGPLKHVAPEKLDLDYIKYLMRGGVLSYEQCMNAAADGPRYKALGNSMCTKNMRWIGARIDAQLRALEVGA